MFLYAFFLRFNETFSNPLPCSYNFEKESLGRDHSHFTEGKVSHRI